MHRVAEPTSCQAGKQRNPPSFAHEVPLLPPSPARSSPCLFLLHGHCSHSPAGTQPPRASVEKWVVICDDSSNHKAVRKPWLEWPLGAGRSPTTSLPFVSHQGEGGQNGSHMSKIPAIHTPTVPGTELAPEASPEMFQEFHEQEHDDVFMNLGPNFAEKNPVLK